MNQPLAAALEISQFLSAKKIKYAIIGGLAVQEWGRARFTEDADFTIAAPLEGADDLIDLLTQHFHSRTTDPRAMARQTRMILIKASNGVKVDISLALPGYEQELFKRAVDAELEYGKSVKICSAEDLIIQKAVAGRPQDIADIESVILRQRKTLKVAYIRRWLNDFTNLLANPEIIQRFERAYRKK